MNSYTHVSHPPVQYQMRVGRGCWKTNVLPNLCVSALCVCVYSMYACDPLICSGVVCVCVCVCVCVTFTSPFVKSRGSSYLQFVTLGECLPTFKPPKPQREASRQQASTAAAHARRSNAKTRQQIQKQSNYLKAVAMAIVTTINLPVASNSAQQTFQHQHPPAPSPPPSVTIPHHPT